MSKIDFDYPANIDRSIVIGAEISDSLVTQIAPTILDFRASSNTPITVYINSNGGSIRSLDYIWDLLTSKGPAGRRPRIITVAIGGAASAAASLLSLGDYAIAYPKADIHFHGVRYGKVEDVTMEFASSMAVQLESKNKLIAQSLALAGTKRLAFHYARLKDSFHKVRVDDAKPELTLIECFAKCLLNQLSFNSERIVNNAINRWRYLTKLRREIVDKAIATGKNGLEFEATVLSGIIESETASRKDSGWCLDESGVIEIVSEYLLLRDYDVGEHRSLVKTIVELYGNAFFTDEEFDQIIAADKNETAESAEKILQARVREVIAPFCYFAASIWREMQRDENPLTPQDAYWLGAVDEVYDSGLPCMREVAEEDEPEQPNLPSSSAT